MKLVQLVKDGEVLADGCLWPQAMLEAAGFAEPDESLVVLWRRTFRLDDSWPEWRGYHQFTRAWLAEHAPSLEVRAVAASDWGPA